MNKARRIAVFASGNGSNAEAIIQKFRGSDLATVGLVLTNNPEAYVIRRAKENSIDIHVFSRSDFYSSNNVLNKLEQYKIDLIVLAGFMWLVPENILSQFSGKIINIHPALLPKFGGKGMYGMHVHEAVLNCEEKKSGITIHYVNERYDEGSIIFQAECEVKLEDSAETLAARIHKLEHVHYPEVVRKICLEN